MKHRLVLMLAMTMLMAGPNMVQAADDGLDEIEREMNQQCVNLAKKMQAANALPKVKLETVTGMATWRRSACDLDSFPDKSKGEVQALCDAQTDGGMVFFWEKKQGKKLKNGFVRCQ